MMQPALGVASGHAPRDSPSGFWSLFPPPGLETYFSVSCLYSQPPNIGGHRSLSLALFSISKFFNDLVTYLFLLGCQSLESRYFPLSGCACISCT